jgi:hypothetical protein
MIRVLTLAGKDNDLLKALRPKAKIEQESNAEGMHKQALLTLEV